MSSASILWHDYETFGVNPHSDRACQFAAIRTDLDLNPIGKPLNWFCQIANDYLPSPAACLITGITPQQTLRDGFIEAEFIARVHKEMSQPNTCVAGYNSIRFDDEVTRFTLFRNFYDPYAREWQNGNSRWDIIDLVRACYALRPDGINWPQKEDGTPSFKLEHLTEANNLVHEAAHDALSDVYATIAMAKLIKSKQAKLYEYGMTLRHKKSVASRIDLHNLTPFIHVSSKVPASQGCCTVMMPVGYHPTNKNAIIAIDLSRPIETLKEHSSEQLADLLFKKNSELESADQRPGLKLVHINRCPFVAPLKTLTPQRADELGIDLAAIKSRHSDILQHSDILSRILDTYDVIDSNRLETEQDVDISLYSEAFPSQTEKEWKSRVLDTPPEQLAELSAPSDSLAKRLFRYRARNYPATLNADEMIKWQNFRRERLMDDTSPIRMNIDQYMQELETLAIEYENDNNRKAIIRALIDYVQNL